MFETGLLILTRPVPVLLQKVQQILLEVSGKVSNTLYVHIQPHSTIPSHNAAFSMAPQPCTTALSDLMTKLYSSNASVCHQLDIYVLLGNVTNKKLSPNLRYKFHKQLDVVLTDFQSSQTNVAQDNVFMEALKLNFSPCSSSVLLQRLSESDDSAKNEDNSMSGTTVDGDSIQKTYPEVVMGGTFDRIHAGHKILLGKGCLLAEERLTVGVTDGEMNKKKVLNELMLPLEQRLGDVRGFIETVKPDLKHWVVPITDMFGPTITEPNIQCIVLSEETKKGGATVNQEREKKGFPVMEEHVISLVEDVCHSQYEEHKISSSSGRKRLLGTLLHPVKHNPNIPQRPYVIGLTGGIASGKSALCKRLEGLGAASVDCDKLGHQAYTKGTPAYHKVIEAFGEGIVGKDGEIQRRSLGEIVFNDPEKLQTLNSIVWPAIGEMAKEKFQSFVEEKKEIVVLEAALLLEAGWDSLVHEVWTSIIPREEAIRRVIERNNLSKEEAEKRLNSQMSNEERVRRSNVVLCTLWEYEYTQQQVEKAWDLLMQRLKERHKSK